MPPCLVVAAPRSGSGKTALTLALACALSRRGLKVQTFKVGPDFLDPTHLALVSGRPCHNLDGWMAGREAVLALYRRAAADADVALVEGVMGLFDGAEADADAGSTAEIARWLGAPVLLVVDVHGMARSLAPLVRGFAAFAPGLTIAGVVANRCGSENHAAWLRRALAAAGAPPLAGALPRGGLPALPSRHLGLVAADETILPPALRETLADAAERHLDLDALFPGLAAPAAAARPGAAASPRAAAPGHAPRQLSLFAGEPAAGADPPAGDATGRTGGPRIAVARDAAFHFYYAALFDALAAAGAEVTFFSPLADSALPPGTAGLYLGGGYPEAHAARLSANGAMRAAIRAHAEAGRPLYAECGGLVYLSRGLATAEGFFPLLGILPAETRMRPQRKALGYVEVSLTEDALWGRRGDTFRGHAFHYSELAGDPAADPAWKRVYALKPRRGGVAEAEGYQRGAVLASYAHLYFASRPEAVARFLTHCTGGPR